VTDAGKEVALEVHERKTEYMLTSRYQNAEKNYDKRTENWAFEKKAQFKYLGAIVKN
jgi:hypothetical protein